MPPEYRMHGQQDLYGGLGQVLQYAAAHLENPEREDERPPDPTKPDKQARRKGKTSTEYDAECAEFIKAECAAGNPPGPRRVKEKLGCGMKTVYKLPSFADYWKERKRGRKPKAVTLTSAMESVVTKGDGELTRLLREQRRDDRSQRVRSRERL
jgi:hypothetical protein